MVDAYRLVFINGPVVYYSYQHPIAFLGRDRLVLRNDFWGRRRGRRSDHIRHILMDVARQTSDAEKTAVDGTDTFFADLHDELEYYGLVFTGAAKPCVPDRNPVNTKRRVIL